MQQLPTDLVRYQLLPFLVPRTAVRLAKASSIHFHTLRHRIRLTGFFTSAYFIKQSVPKSLRIGMCSAVSVKGSKSLRVLRNHIKNETVNKLSSLLHLTLDFDEFRDQLVCPESLHTLTFGRYFDQSLYRVSLPSSLHTLEFGHNFDQQLTGITLPANLHTLKFGTFFDKALVAVTLPINLHTLEFGLWFDQSLAEVRLPVKLHTLTFGKFFNPPLAVITFPASLRILSLGGCFGQSLHGIQFPDELFIRKEGTVLAAHLLPPELRIMQYSYSML